MPSPCSGRSGRRDRQRSTGTCRSEPEAHVPAIAHREPRRDRDPRRPDRPRDGHPLHRSVLGGRSDRPPPDRDGRERRDRGAPPGADRPEGLAESFEAAQSVAGANFGNPDLFLEKYLQKARHVEVQVLIGDRGAGVGFVERECSVQRRHQKLVEETPSPAIGAAVRRRLQEVAVRGLQSLGYRNAGTVEFLFHDRRFTFNEVNARLQVEHPITEMVTGVDLVRQQLRVASGEGIEFSQSEMRWKGHAIECRINAEDPLRNFLPSPGRIVDFRVPAGSQIRVDAGVAAGSIVPAFYDPLIAKLVVGGFSRDTAVRRMLQSVDAFEFRGIHTTLPFHRVLLSDRDFVKGNLWTTMVDDLRLVARIRSRGPWEQRIAEIAAAVAASGRLMSGPTVDLMGSKASAWSAAGRRQLLAGGDHAVPPRRRW